jgi:hypothetical protein
MARLVLGKQRGQLRRHQAVQHDDVQIAADPARFLRRARLDLGQVGEQRAAALRIADADFGEHRLARRALQQLHAEVRFEIADIARHERWRQVQLVSGMGEVMRVGNLERPHQLNR